MGRRLRRRARLRARLGRRRRLRLRYGLRLRYVPAQKPSLAMNVEQVRAIFSAEQVQSM